MVYNHGPLIGFPLGGFVTTYFAKDRKIRYGIYEGLLLAVVTSIGNPLLGYHDLNIVFIVAIFTIYPLLTGTGGFIGKITDRHLKQNVEKTEV